MVRQVDHRTEHDGANHGDQRARNAAVDALAEDHDADDHQREDERGNVRLAEVCHVVNQLLYGSALRAGDAEDARYLVEGHLNTDAGEEADEDGAREKVGDEAQPDDTGEQHEQPGQQRQDGRISHVFRRSLRGDPYHASGHNGGRCRVCLHHQVAR